MSAAARFLALWLTPAVWLEMPVLMVDRGPDGLGIALALMAAPLIALGIQSRELPAADPNSRFPALTLLFVVGLLVWANLSLAGDLASGLGAPRWQGIAIAAAGGWAFAALPGVARLAAPLLLVAILAVSAPLAEHARTSRINPLGAWSQVASQATFRFPADSPWVTAGGDLAAVGGRAIAFDEEHRITAPAGGRLRARIQDGRRSADLEWTLAPGQSVTLRPGDRLYADPGVRVRFEADKRVPGSPASGIAWAAGLAPDWPRQAGLLVTVLFGAAGLLRAGRRDGCDRRAVTVVGGGALLALVWAQAAAIYTLLDAPDLFVVGVTPARLLARLLPAADSSHHAASALRVVALAGTAAAFLASSVALRDRLSAWRATVEGRSGRDTELWAGLFAAAALASLRPVGPWSLALCALGAAASILGPVTIWSNHTATATAAQFVGLTVFASLTALAVLRPGAAGLAGAMLAYPAIAAVPASALALWIGGRPYRQRARRVKLRSDPN
jgi:hypothetical protein